MRPRALMLLAALLALTMVAGADPGTLVLWPDGTGHLHSDPAQHDLALNMALRGYLNVGEAIGEVDIAEDAQGHAWAFVALLNAGFAIVDIDDPTAPSLVTKARSGVAGYGADVKVSDDSNTVFLSINSGSLAPPCFLGFSPAIVPVPVALVCGVQVWDTTDKDAPMFLYTLPTSTAGSHMMDYEQFLGLPVIAMAAQGMPQNVPIAIAPADKAPVIVGHLATSFVHDVTLRADPLDPMRLLAFAANWDEGVRIFDVTIPVSLGLPDVGLGYVPVLFPQVGHWPAPAGSGGNIHTVMPFAVEGRRIIAAQQEAIGPGGSTLWLLDATDLGDIQVLGTWRNPDGRASGGGLRWSTHNLNVVEGNLYLAHYHGGVVTLGVGTLAELASPPLLGNYLPHMPRVSGSFSSDVPYTWDALPRGDTVWATDVNSGLYALRMA